MDCRIDLLVCIDWVAESIGIFLKDGVTMSCLAASLVLLVRVRGRQRQARDAAYAAGLLGSSDQLFAKTKQTWIVGSEESKAKPRSDEGPAA